jgi:hypothetical protein
VPRAKAGAIDDVASLTSAAEYSGSTTSTSVPYAQVYLVDHLSSSTEDVFICFTRHLGGSP